MSEEARRQSDKQLGELIGSFRIFMEQYKEDRTESSIFRERFSARLDRVEAFVDEMRVPHRAAKWTLRTVAVATLGIAIKTLWEWLATHIHYR